MYRFNGHESIAAFERLQQATARLYDVDRFEVTREELLGITRDIRGLDFLGLKDNYWPFELLQYHYLEVLETNDLKKLVRIFLLQLKRLDLVEQEPPLLEEAVPATPQAVDRRRPDSAMRKPAHDPSRGVVMLYVPVSA